MTVRDVRQGPPGGGMPCNLRTPAGDVSAPAPLHSVSLKEAKPWPVG